MQSDRRVQWTGWVFIVALSAASAGAQTGKDSPALGDAKVRLTRGSLSISALHAQLPRLTTALEKEERVPYRVDPALGYKRIHVFAASYTPVRLRSVVARMSRATWQTSSEGFVLVPRNGWRTERDQLRRKHPLPEKPTPTPEARLDFARKLVLRAQEEGGRAGPGSLLGSRPLARSAVAALGELTPLHLLLLSGPQGVAFSENELSPTASRRLLQELQRERPDSIGLDRVQLRIGTDGRLAVAVHGKTGDGSEVALGQVLTGVGPGAEHPANHHGPANDSPPNSKATRKPEAAEPLLVEPSAFLVRDPRGPVPYRFTESLQRLSRQYGVEIAADILYRAPVVRPGPDPQRDAYRTLAVEEGEVKRVPLSAALEAFATIFGCDYEVHEGTHLLRNPAWYWEEEFAHSDEVLGRLLRTQPGHRGRLATLSSLLPLGSRVAEGLTTLFPEMVSLHEDRGEVVFFAALGAEQQERLASITGLPATGLQPRQLPYFWPLVGAAPAVVPPPLLARIHLQSDVVGNRERITFQVRPPGQ